ncbi:riboflavin synthase [Rubrimonas cliftonensis]|uniref:Riboflavin synthase n=1 Tax=Rubrimonas cliftonensis TaxID=89524 RepID=A0A1H4GEV2_9RHOB|nr:riboflavin synthase [Rubrimonas cliftonensis]SEB07811.1 riboflavin synthase alpha chain [Rubrimonas cliftonensis]
MFTGIITDIGEVAVVEPVPGGLRARIRSAYDLAGVALGASIACDGVCLTVTDKAAGGGSGGGWFAVDVSGETVSRSTLGGWAPGRRVNLERSLKVGDELGGHIVSGHVDGVGEVVEARPDGESTRVVIAAPAALAGFIAPKGSIAVDGASLTVNEVEDGAEGGFGGGPGGGARFGVNLIPHTRRWTTFADMAPGRRVNLEIDVLARYVARLKEVAGGG